MSLYNSNTNNNDSGNNESRRDKRHPVNKLDESKILQITFNAEFDPSSEMNVLIHASRAKC